MALVHRFVQLPHPGVDAHLPEQGLHAEGAGLVRDDGDHQPAHVFVLQQFGQEANEGHGGRDLPVSGTGVERFVQVVGRQRDRPALVHPRRHEPAQGLAPFREVDHLGRVRIRSVKRHRVDVFVGDGDPESGPERLEFLLVELFLLMGDVFPLSGFAQAVALDGASQDDRGRPLVCRGGRIGRVHFFRVVATQVDAPQLLVGQVVHQFEQLRVLAEEVVADVVAPPDDVVLPLAVHVLAHAPGQKAVFVPGQERVPLAAPEDLDHVPARPAEARFQLLDDAAVSPDRSVQTLQVAVDHENEVVQLFPGRKGNGAQGLGFVGLAVPHEHPHLRIRRRF